MAINGFKVHGALVLAVLASGVGAAVAGAGSGGVVLAGPQVLRLLQQAPAALDSYPALRMTMTMRISGHAQGDVTLTGTSTPDGRSGVMSMEVPSLGTYVDMELVNGRMFARRSGASRWLACSLSSSTAPAMTGTGADALAYLRLMPGATGPVRVLGHATIDGVKTTHYRVDIDVAQAAEAAAARGDISVDQSQLDQLKQVGITTLPVDAWLDEQNALRQFAFSMHFQGLSMSMKMRIRGTETVPTVTAPAPTDVTDFGSCQLMVQQLGHAVG